MFTKLRCPMKSVYYSFSFIVLLSLSSCGDHLTGLNRDHLPQAADTIARYFLDGDAVDESGHGHSGALMGPNSNAPALNFGTDRFGKPGRALLLDGTNFVQVPASAELTFTHDDSFTINAWVWCDSWQYPYIGYAGIVQKGPICCDKPGYALSIAGPRAIGQIQSQNMDLLWGKTDVTDGQWHMLTYVVVAHTSIAVYVDGILDTLKNDPIMTPELDNTSDLFIGRYGGHDWNFTGLIDDVLILRKAWSLAEIATAFHEGGWMPVSPGCRFAVDSLPRTSAIVDADLDSTRSYTFVTQQVNMDSLLLRLCSDGLPIEKALFAATYLCKDARGPRPVVVLSQPDTLILTRGFTQGANGHLGCAGTELLYHPQ